jgi:hypothetical protein
MKVCPACKELINVSALRCKFCTHEMSHSPVTGQTSGETAAGWIKAIGYLIIGVILWQMSNDYF